MSEPTVTLDGLVLPAGTITGRAADVRADNLDPDPHPQVDAWEGQQVTFTPTVGLVVYETDDGPVVLRPRPEVGRFVDGRLVLDIPPAEGESWNPLRLWASIDQPMVPAEWGYTMSGLPGVKPRPFALAPGATVDVGAIIADLLPDVPPPDYVDLLAALAEMREIRTVATGAATRAEKARDETEAEVITGLTWSGSVSLTDLASAPRVLHATLTGNVTLALPTPDAGRALTLTLVLQQDAVGGRTVTIPGTRAAWSARYVHTGTPGSVDVVHLMWTGTAWLVLPGAQNVGVPS